jgi:predicted PurR-regulated permease PerM
MTKKKHTTIQLDAKFAHTFLLVSLLGLGILVAWMFKPFLIDIILAGVLASFFYPVYKKVLEYVNNVPLSAFITLLIIGGLIFVPLVQFGIFMVNQAILAYNDLVPFIQNRVIIDQAVGEINRFIAFAGITPEQVQTILQDFAGAVNGYLINISTLLVKGTTQFLLSTVIIGLTVFYLFIDGKKLLRKFMNLTPLPNKYDAQLFQTFRNMSYSTIVSTLMVAVFQGLLGGISFAIVGLPAFFPGIIMALLSILPYIGPPLIMVPAAAWLFVTGQYWQGIIITLLALIVSNGDNILRAYLIKGKSQVHEIFIFFSLLGGLILFGFWGIIIGPLILALLFTVIDIYEKEFAGQLEIEK